MKFSTQDKSNMLITNISIRINELDPELKCVLIFMKFDS